jgi:hypothetical protein
MRRLAVTLAAVAALAGAGAFAPPSADAALSRGKALQRAERAAKQHAREDRRITEWEITRGFRFGDRKWVWAWWAQLGDGRICSAQLVTRYNSSKTNKLIAYFRNEDCA